MRLLESAVRDFGVGLVCIGGDQAYAAGGYRGTPLEEMLPVEMELSSKKVLPNGALAIVCHATEFPGGNALGARHRLRRPGRAGAAGRDGHRAVGRQQPLAFSSGQSRATKRKWAAKFPA